MRRLVEVILLLWVGLASASGQGEDLLLIYSEQDPGDEPNSVRYLIHGDFMRSDYGPDSSGFLLFDRAAGAIYSVNEEEHNILVLQPGEQTLAPPYDLQLREIPFKLDDVPKVDGKQPRRFDYAAKGEPCFSVYAVAGLLPKAQAMLKGFHSLLGREQARLFDRIPAEMQGACDMARYVFAPVRQFRHGLPVREWDEYGFERILVDFRRYPRLDPALFELPKGYTRFSMEEVDSLNNNRPKQPPVPHPGGG